MKTYRDESGRRVLEVGDLSFLGDRDHRYGWLRRHILHFRMHLELRRADHVVAESEAVAADLVRYYFVPKDRISLKHQ